MDDCTAPGPGEHVISWAYPSSPRAVALGFPGAGCYVLRVHGEDPHGYDLYATCVAVVGALGTNPGRWSMDHPAHAKYLPAAAI
jgi:hypothetical protein